MILTETPIPGAYVIEPERIEDHRGFFARVFCEDELGTRGLETRIVQINVGYNKVRGTLRGLHFQRAPYAEVKIVRCTRGAIYDVIVDLRPDSPAFKQWFGLQLNEENSKMLYVPKGCAQGYLTLTDSSEMCYLTSESYHPEAASGIRYNDPGLKIVWPAEITVVSQQDRNWPDYFSVKLLDTEDFG